MGTLAAQLDANEAARTWRIGLSQGQLRLLLTPCLIFIVACLDRQFQTDFWMHLARGCEIVGTGNWITADHFTIAARNAAICDPNWLSQVVYCRLFSWGGLALVQAVNAGVLAGTAGVLVSLCRRGGASSRAAGMAAVVYFVLVWQTFLIRPQTVSVLLFTLLYSVLRRGTVVSVLTCAPVILLLWVNVHGAFGIGLVLIGVFGVARVFEDYAFPIESATTRLSSSAPFGERRRRTALEFAGGLRAIFSALRGLPRPLPDGRGSSENAFGLREHGRESTPPLPHGRGCSENNLVCASTRMNRLLRSLTVAALIGGVSRFSYTAGAAKPHANSDWIAGLARGTVRFLKFRGRAACLYGVALLLSGLATLVNPYGWGVYRYAAGLTARVAPRHLEEWMPPRLDQGIGIALWGSMVLLVGLYVVRRRRPGVLNLLLMVGFGALGLHAVRMVVWWGVVTAPILAELLTNRDGHGSEKALNPSGPATVVGVLLGALCAGSLPQLERVNPLFGRVRSSHRIEAEVDSVATVGGLALNGRGVFTRMEWAQYLSWRLGPRNRLLIDSHVELFDDAAWREYCSLSAGAAGWEQILDRRGIDYLLLDDSYHAALLREARSSRSWDQITQSGHAILLVRHILADSLAECGRFNRTDRYTGNMRAEGDGGQLPASVLPCQTRRLHASTLWWSMMGPMAGRGSAGGSRQFYGR